MNNKVKTILFYFFMMEVAPFPVMLLLNYLTKAGALPPMSKTTQEIFINVIIYVILPLVTFILMRKDLSSDLKKSGKLLGRVIPLILVVYASSILGSILVHLIDHTTTSVNQSILMNMKQENLGLVIYMTVFSAPFVEETVFRHCILSNRRGFFGIVMLLLSSALFGLVHVHQFSMGAFLSYAILGLTLGIIYYKNRNLVLSILVHSGYNGIILILTTIINFKYH